MLDPGIAADIPDASIEGFVTLIMVAFGILVGVGIAFVRERIPAAFADRLTQGPVGHDLRHLALFQGQQAAGRQFEHAFIDGLGRGDVGGLEEGRQRRPRNFQPRPHQGLDGAQL